MHTTIQRFELQANTLGFVRLQLCSVFTCCSSEKERERQRERERETERERERERERE